MVPAAARPAVVPRPVRKLAGVCAVLLAWWLVTATGAVPETVLPSPAAVARAAAQLIADRSLIDALVISLQRVGSGLAIGVVLGGILALVSGFFRLGEDLIDAPMQMLRTVPWPGLIPLFIIWFGIDEAPKVALVAFAVVFPLYVNLYAGIRSVDKGLVDAARALGVGRAGLVAHVILPGSLPNALVGLRWAIGSAWLALVFGETVNAQSGIGYLLMHAREVYRTDVIVVALVVYALLGLSADLLVRGLEQWLLRWRPAFAGS
ncbi:ABC transporter permease [Amycolatopsis benzoatilytica]|uniref:ABC transporter permease n=1 Tax=Amycolatopsis benzoatilytica TaxID=346045 RepID=UPI001FDF1F14|nr:ABC transporter permease [Amycolatopsis benzoatilytica]